MNPLEIGQDCFVGILDPSPIPAAAAASFDGGVDRGIEYTFSSVVGGRSWPECALGMFCTSGPA